MDTALSPDGDYILGENGIPVKIYDTKELLQKILIKLTTKIGSFIYDTNLGSDLNTLKDAEDILINTYDLNNYQIDKRYLEAKSNNQKNKLVINKKVLLDITKCLQLYINRSFSHTGSTPDS